MGVLSDDLGVKLGPELGPELDPELELGRELALTLNRADLGLKVSGEARFNLRRSSWDLSNR